MRKKVGVFMVLLMTVLAGLPDLASAATLTKPEIDALLLMREEEKMARDVYLQLNDLWGLPIFQNIELSEQTHMDAVKTLLDRYGLQDPAAGRGVGEFSNEDLQILYDDLMEYGGISVANALEVGIEIEKTDIGDLEEALKITKRKDIRRVFSNLLQGSYRHLEAFHRVLDSSE
jgi:hypothetical protein